MTRKRNYKLIEEIMRLLHVEKKEKRVVALELSDRYQISTTTIYRNMSEIDKIIKDQINVLTLLRTASLQEREFEDDFEKIRRSLK